ncbi:flavodoxin [Candidatus Ruminimicrobium bovinum]|uniref:flavodoxin n=1 Tax=Candidatus Ruminimicrobium bovinum TaxID=3242779 RepID=UPI0039B9C9DC
MNKTLKMLSLVTVLSIALLSCSKETVAVKQGETNMFFKDKKVAIVYFSVSNNTKKFAETIQKLTGGDLIRLEPVVAYNSNPNEVKQLIADAKKETESDVRPEFKSINFNVADYDIVFVGYPVWWYTLPMIFYTFFDTYDFSGKTIIPFNTHEGSGEGGTYSTIKKWEPNATILEGLPIRGGNMAKDQTETIKKWLNNIK